MSPRVSFLVIFLLIPVFAKRGGGGSSRGGGGHVSHSYPTSHGLSGHATGQSATYPQSTGLSGNNANRGTHTTTYHKTEVHHHHYNPPQQINYGSGYHPVYHGNPPIYITQYRNSGSRFDTLLTGLALYNLGRMSSHHDSHYYDPHREYRGSPDETCKLQISKTNGEFEETRIDCKLMSSFIWEAEREQNRVVSSNTVTTVNVTRVEHTNTENNGTVVTTTVQNTTVVDALNVKGPSIQVTPGMSCFMIRISRYSSTLKKKVDCGLLEAYSVSSFRSNAWRNKPKCIVTLFSLILYLRYYLVKI